jgi:diguanylate cyclase (GGDEF)-like protein
MTEAIAPAQVWLGACVGAQVLLVLLTVIQANAYRERSLLLHGAATLMAVVAVESLMGDNAALPPAVLLFVPALAGLQLMALVSNAGSLRLIRRWLAVVSAGVLPLLAVAAAYTLWALAAGMVLWTAVVVLLLLRAWRQSRPWVWWLPPGLAALGLAGFAVAASTPSNDIDDALLVGGLLTIWSACTYLASVWRGRIAGETRVRIRARNTIDPLTGLATPLVLGERITAARHIMRRYGHPSAVMVVHIENLPALASEFGLEAAESAVLAAASRVRDSLPRDGDVAARLAHARIGVLVEGAAPAEAAASVATRILVAGLKEPLAAARAEYLRFRIVLAAVPPDDTPPKQLLYKLNQRMDQELRGGSERRIVTLTQDFLTAPAPLTP